VYPNPRGIGGKLRFFANYPRKCIMNRLASAVFIIIFSSSLRAEYLLYMSCSRLGLPQL
jgi:hypothetical protein